MPAPILVNVPHVLIVPHRRTLASEKTLLLISRVAASPLRFVSFPLPPFHLRLFPVRLSRSSSLRVPPSPQQFIIITSPQCDGAHLRLIMWRARPHVHRALTQEWDPLKPYYMSDCASDMGDYPWDCMLGQGQESRVGWAHTHILTRVHTSQVECKAEDTKNTCIEVF